MAVSFELGSVLDKAYEDKSLTEILAAPPGSGGSDEASRPDTLRRLWHSNGRRTGSQQTFRSGWSAGRALRQDLIRLTAAPCYAGRAFHVLP
jgi:hypothetical protein